MEAEVDLHEGTPFRSLRFADEPQAGFLRRAIGFLGIAGDARTNNIFPRRGPAVVARNDMVQVQVFPLQNQPAILASVFVPLKNVVPGKFDFLLGQAIEHHQQDDARDANAEGDGANAFRMRVQGPGSQQGLSFGRSGHGRPYNTAETVCQELNAHMGATPNSGTHAQLVADYALHRGF